MNGEVDYWGLDVLGRRIMICEFIRKLLGVNITAASEYTPARVPGLYAALEKAYQGMTLAAFTGCQPSVGIGHLEYGLTFSMVQLLLEREFINGLKFLERPVIDTEAIGLDTIMDIGFGGDRNYLDAEHTMRNFHESLWDPVFFDKGGWTVEREEKILKKAREKVKEYIGEHKKPDRDPTTIKKMRAVIERAKICLKS